MQHTDASLCQHGIHSSQIFFGQHQNLLVSSKTQRRIQPCHSRSLQSLRHGTYLSSYLFPSFRIPASDTPVTFHPSIAHIFTDDKTVVMTICQTIVMYNSKIKDILSKGMPSLNRFPKGDNYD